MLIDEIFVHGPSDANFVGEPLAPAVHVLEGVPDGARPLVDRPPEPRHLLRLALQCHQLQPVDVE